MSIFVDPKDRVEITATFKEVDGKLAFLNKQEEGSESLTVKFSRPDFALSQQMLQSSQTTAPGGELSLDFLALQRTMFVSLAKEWDAKDVDGKEIVLTPTALGRLRPELANYMITKLVEKIGVPL